MSGKGHNQPPADEAIMMELEDVYLEASNFLDGEAIANKAQADTIGTIVTKARQLKSQAEKARKEEKEPHLEAGREVDARFKKVTLRADTIIKTAQAPLTAWLEAEEARQREVARKAAEEAEKAQQAAIEREREAARAGELEQAEEAEKARQEADKLSAQAKKAAKAKPQVAGVGRSMGLRTVQTAEVEDYKELLQHIMKNNPEPLRAWLREQAQKALPSKLPGVIIRSERKAQ